MICLCVFNLFPSPCTPKTQWQCGRHRTFCAPLHGYITFWEMMVQVTSKRENWIFFFFFLNCILIRASETSLQLGQANLMAAKQHVERFWLFVFFLGGGLAKGFRVTSSGASQPLGSVADVPESRGVDTSWTHFRKTSLNSRDVHGSAGRLRACVRVRVWVLPLSVCECCEFPLRRTCSAIHTALNAARGASISLPTSLRPSVPPSARSAVSLPPSISSRLAARDAPPVSSRSRF